MNSRTKENYGNKIRAVFTSSPSIKKKYGTVELDCDEWRRHSRDSEQGTVLKLLFFSNILMIDEDSNKLSFEVTSNIVDR